MKESDRNSSKKLFSDNKTAFLKAIALPEKPLRDKKLPTIAWVS
ncbi:MAG: DUF4464 domain-containing protein [Richelia sp. RM1_1_1]|nr:DUF4464 domain-containing protein [Richelia sp. RM1_1_1]